jgi:hypothetical protein
LSDDEKKGKYEHYFYCIVGHHGWVKYDDDPSDMVRLDAIAQTCPEHSDIRDEDMGDYK